MSKLAITLYNREYFVNCDPGEESQLKEVVRFVEDRMHQVAHRAGNTTELRLLMLTCLQMADELLDLRRDAAQKASQDEDLLVAAVDHLQQRVAHIASQVGRA
ncbi:MAG: cell division protein ZapA [Alphaproteobacteria bacterium]|nr:cell division protein ZapA [Alphaproteobacteria bacterium]